MKGLTVAKWIKNIKAGEWDNLSPIAGDVYYREDDGAYYLFKDGQFIGAESSNIKEIKTTDWRTELYLQGVRDTALGLETNYYYPELVTEWPKLYDIVNGKYYEKSFSDIDFFLDFIDDGATYQAFNVNAIGRRTKTINDNTINCIAAPAIPDYILIKAGQEDTDDLRQEANANGQNYIQVSPGMYSSIVVSSSTNAAYDNIKMLLHEYTSYNENVSITTLPIYYLEPNTRITIEDNDTCISGDYMLNSFSLPLAYNGTMTLQCKRALERI